ncbi:MAG: redox-sensing transcriptional repressor Rex [Eubacteriales bacterium]|nr:redox-sensing transcriptional repressor Rex [Eubacteriales bacterium]
MSAVNISHQALNRMPCYLQYLCREREMGRQYITATAIAEAMRLNEVQVRKDIASVSSRPGKPMVGFFLPDLIADIQRFLGEENVWDAVLVGAGSMGRALMSYTGFAAYGLNIVCAFDIKPQKEPVCGRMVYPMGEMEHLCRRLHVRMGILTTPASAAQSACDQMVRSGIIAIWNFAPTFVRVPEGILVQNELLASSAAVLLRQMQEDEQELSR